MNNLLGLRKLILAALASSFLVAIVFPFVASADYRWVNSSTIQERRQTGQHTFEHVRYYGLAEGYPLSIYSSSVGGASPYGAQFNTQPVDGYCAYHIQVSMMTGEGSINLVKNKRTSGSCAASDEYTPITVKDASTKAPIHMYLDDSGKIRSVHTDKASTSFSPIRSSALPDSITGGTEEVYYQDSPSGAECPAILFKYKESGNWGFIRPKKHNTTREDTGSEEYRGILSAAGLSDVYGGCEVSGSKGDGKGRNTTERGLEALVYGQLNYWNEHNGNNYQPCSDKWVSFLEIWSSSVYCLGTSFVGAKADAPFSTGVADPPDGVGSDTGAEEDDIVTCAVDGIGWIICPVMNFLADVADGAYGFLSNNFLETQSSVTKAEDTNAVYTSWQAMRNLANALFVIAFIIIIYSQMTGAGISNYGVKRMLPRLVIAAILVNVSFFICQLAVDLSNVLGYSIRSFFEGLAPSGAGVDLGADATGSGAAGFFGGIVAIVLIGGAFYLFASALIPILLGAVVALIMILFILLARQALIILLIVLSPVAFVAYLLPNTQQWFDRWRKIFTALLLVFPIIGLVFGASQLASAIVTATANPDIKDVDDASMWAQIIGAGIAILPLFIVPGILKKSLDSVGNIGARINSIGGKMQGAAKTRGQSSRLAQLGKYGQHKRALSRASSQAGRNRFRGGGKNPLNWGSAVNRGINKLGGEGFTDFTGDEKLVDGMVAELRKDPLNALGNASSAYVKAASNGDTMGAQAALKVMGGMGARGQEEISKSIIAAEKAGSIHPGVASATRKALAGSSDPANLRYSFTNKPLSEIQADKSTYSGLTSGKVAGMSPESIQRAMKAGGIDPSISSELLGANSRHDLNVAQRNALLGQPIGDSGSASLPVPPSTSTRQSLSSSGAEEVSVNVRDLSDEQVLNLSNDSPAVFDELDRRTAPPEGPGPTQSE